ncbi:hypothetical protein D3C72_1310150 [compost metagenome]
MLAGSVHQGVLVDPAHPGGIGAELGASRGGQIGCHLAQILQHPGTGPVEVGVVVKQHIDEGVAEEGVAAHRGGPRHRQHGGGERVGHLILHHLGRLARVGRLDDHLDVGEIRQGVHRGLLHRPEPPGGEHDGQQQHQKAVADGPANDGRNHDLAPCSWGAASEERLLAKPRMMEGVMTSSPSRASPSDAGYGPCLPSHPLPAHQRWPEHSPDGWW